MLSMDAAVRVDTDDKAAVVAHKCDQSVTNL
jgi:hypothetical protein